MAGKRAVQFEGKVIYLELNDEGTVVSINAAPVVVTEMNFDKTVRQVAEEVIAPKPAAQ